MKFLPRKVVSMSSIRVVALALLCASALTPALAASVKPTWPQDNSDIKPDPDVHFGVLANGMHYIIQRNLTPPGQAVVRMRVGSGSDDETDAQRGLAHVLEHMSFKGSKHVPKGDMVQILERKGLAFGADTNAQTAFRATTFELDVPETKGDTLDTVLMLMRETASELTLDPKALEPERGVVLSEARMRDTPSYRAMTQALRFAMPDTLYVKRFPIGKVHVVQTAPVSEIRKFYEANYRPKRTTLIVVGDIDVKKVEALIHQHFDSWKPQAPALPKPDFGTIKPGGTAVKVINEPGAGTSIEIGFARSFKEHRDTVANETRQLQERVASTIFSKRLMQRVNDPQPPFLSGYAGPNTLEQTARGGLIDVSATPQGWPRALAAATRALRQIVHYGVTPNEVALATRDLEVSFQAAAESASTRTSDSIAQNMLSNVSQNGVITSPAEDLKLFEAAKAKLTVAAVDRALKHIFSGTGPTVIVTSAPVAGLDDATLAKAFAADEAAPLTPPTAHLAKAWPYTSFGTPGKVISDKHIADLGVDEIEFANHVRLNVKSTKFRKDQILVTVDFGQGRLGLDPKAQSSAWLTHAFLAGGLGKLTPNQLQDAATGHVVQTDFNISEDHFRLSGSTRTQDFALEMQMLAAYMTDPAYRAEAVARLQQGYLNALPQLAATMSGALTKTLDSFIHGDDRRWGFPSEANIKAASPQRLKAIMAEPLAKSPIEITIVGDISKDAAIAQIAQTFGALPMRDDLAATTPATESLPKPSATPTIITHGGKADEAASIAIWPTQGLFKNIQTDRAIMLARDILENRLLARLRVKDGDTYSPQGTAMFSQSVPSYGYVYERIDTKPQLVPKVFAAINEVTADMAKNGVTPDEMVRAKAPSLEQRKHMFTNNAFWLADLSGIQAHPQELDVIRTLATGMEKITAADVQAATKRFLNQKNMISFIAKPGKALR